MTTAEALKELMDKYNESRPRWIAVYGSDKGFDQWFRNQCKVTI